MPGLIFAATIAGATALVAAQDPVETLPHAYTLVLENEWVKVVRVHYAPHVKLPAHAHTDWAAAYVYVNDSGPVVFRHVGAEYGAVTRKPTKAGMFRLYRAVREIHEVENLSALPSDFLRVEFKTDAPEAALLRGRYERAAVRAHAKSLQVQFENAQVRVTRIYVPARMPIDLPTTQPGLLVSLGEQPFGVGGVRWYPPGGGVHLDAARAPAELLWFELKTQPVDAK